MGSRLLIVVVVDRQVHGYRQGHQLLATSVRLSKSEQSVIDRLSDVAGPLRPRERFTPYLSAYPLPNGEYYVLARTWQDSTVARAGCVRTLSLVIPIADWSVAESLSPFLDLLEFDGLPQSADATQRVISSSEATPLPPVRDFSAGELLEALFLEEFQPVVVFDAPRPDVIALRLLTALWPSIRRQFSLSTLALSPRKVAGRDFDLVFAPKDARARFSDWIGRRVDGRSDQITRHRWTGAIATRVFEEPRPQLLKPQQVDLVSGDHEIDDVTRLRIALLWDELFEKLDSTPTAALGLLDIANSGKVRDAVAIDLLEPALATAVQQATVDLSTAEAWDFLGAVIRKIQGRSMAQGRSALNHAAGDLAARAPEGAIALLAQSDPSGSVASLVPRIAEGIGVAFDDRAEKALLAAPAEVLGRLVAEGGLLAQRVTGDALLINRLGEVLRELDAPLADAVAAELLPYLLEDWQLPAAEPLLKRLDEAGLVEEARHLGLANDFAAARLSDLVIGRAREVGAKEAVRRSIAGLPPTDRRDAMLARTLDPSVPDVSWLLSAPELTVDTATRLLLDQLRAADDHTLAGVIGDAEIGDDVIRRVEIIAPDLLQRVILCCELPIDTFVRVIGSVLANSDSNSKARIADKALQQCLGEHFEGSETDFLATMLELVGERLDGPWLAQIGLGRGVQASVASRNMVVFRDASAPARRRIVEAIADVAQALCDRRTIDLNAPAAEACAHLMFEAEEAAPVALLSAAGRLLPMLMRHRREPISLMVAAAFPVVYRELAKNDDVPDLLRFVPFLDWDRCKAARRELVSAFISSSWAPGDLALTACRCDDVDRIMRRTAKSYGGYGYIDLVSADTERLPDGCRKSVERAISSIKSDARSMYAWRD